MRGQRRALPPWASVQEWLNHPQSALERGHISRDDIEDFKAYMHFKDDCQDLCRKIIYQRDRHSCLACGATGALNLAHLTPVGAFIHQAGRITALIDAYTEDNLVTLCEPCHMAFHMVGRLSVDYQRRQLAVRGIFAHRMRQRQWVSAAEFYGLTTRPEPLPVQLRKRGLI